ncbi:hypothetical protein HDU84_009599 [Entophlyctis sp. JEL0112]|nr:hypothetical protein HDU84_009599 [Entophlyctis sp. JEL0112]
MSATGTRASTASTALPAASVSPVPITSTTESIAVTTSAVSPGAVTAVTTSALPSNPTTSAPPPSASVVMSAATVAATVASATSTTISTTTTAAAGSVASASSTGVTSSWLTTVGIVAGVAVALMAITYVFRKWFLNPSNDFKSRRLQRMTVLGHGPVGAAIAERRNKRSSGYFDVRTISSRTSSRSFQALIPERSKNSANGSLSRGSKKSHSGNAKGSGNLADLIPARSASSVQKPIPLAQYFPKPANVGVYPNFEASSSGGTGAPKYPQYPQYPQVPQQRYGGSSF